MMTKKNGLQGTHRTRRNARRPSRLGTALALFCTGLVATPSFAQRVTTTTRTTSASRTETVATTARTMAVADTTRDSSRDQLTSLVAKPPEWDAGCPVPTLDECMQEGFLEGELDGRNGCGALQGENDWTCSELMQGAVAQLPSTPGVFVEDLASGGVVGSSKKLPQDASAAVATSFTPEMSSPANMFYGASIVSEGMNAFSVDAEYQIEDPREFYPNDGAFFDSCQEYAYERYYDVTNFWFQVGRDRHDYLRTYEIAFGPLSADSSVGSLRAGNASPFASVDGDSMLPSSREVYRNRFLDLPGGAGIDQLWIGQIAGAKNAAAASAPKLRASLRDYSSMGETIVNAIEDVDDVLVSKDMAYYRDHFENLTVEGDPEAGPFFEVPGADEGGSDPESTLLFGGADEEDEYELAAETPPGGDLTEITGQVPLDFSGPKVMRRMFSVELDELYDLQVEKDRIVREWKSLDRIYTGSGWTVGDLIDELNIDDYTFHPQSSVPVDPGTGNGGATQIANTQPGGGVCCGESDVLATLGGGDDADPVGPNGIVAELPPTPPTSNLTAESADRKAVLDALISVYAKADAAGCLDEGHTYCDFSAKEFALEAITQAVSEQQAAYEVCVSQLPSPFYDNLGTTRTIIDPEADTAHVDAAYKTEGEDTDWLGWQDLEVLECHVTIPDEVDANGFDQIITKSALCQGDIPLYKAELASFLAGYEGYQAKIEAQERLAEIPELIDPDTGELRMPGRSASWDERKGSDYFGLGMQYNYAFETNTDDNVCNFDLIAGGDFSADFDLLGNNLPLVDVDAWVRTQEEFVEVKAEVAGVALFDALEVNGLADGETVEFTFANAGGSLKQDFVPYTQNFMLGPVPLSLSVGAGGRLGYRLDWEGEFQALAGNADSIDLCPSLALNANLEPFVGVYGFIEVALDIGIAAAGVRGEVTILDLSTPVSLGMGLEAFPLTDTGGIDLGLTVDMSVSARFESLSGRISAFGEIGPCPFCKRIEKNIVKWDGFISDQEIFSQNYAVSVHDLVIALDD